MTPPANLDSALLVIGYGNTLRGDDGVGPRVAEAVEAMAIPGVRVHVCALLTPELAEQISQARSVVFVDAAVDAPNVVRLQRIEARESPPVMVHAADPRTMLALARDVFGRAPRAWWLTIPAVELGFGEGLSPEARRGFAAAVGTLRAFCRRGRPPVRGAGAGGRREAVGRSGVGRP